jgi:tetratricopeptide (TPR) repeat protein
VELEPTCLVFNNILGLNLLYARNYEGAIEQLRQTVAMDPFSASVRLDLAVAYELQGRYDAAVAEWEKCSQLFGESAENLLVRRAAFQAGDIRAYWQKEKEQLKERIGREPALAIHLARVCTFLGETDESFVWLGRAYVQHDDYLKYVTVDPTFDPLRSDPRFHGILKDMRLE